MKITPDPAAASGRERGYRIEAVVLAEAGEATDLAAAVAFALQGYHVGPITVQPVEILSSEEALT